MDEIIRFCINHKDVRISFRYNECEGPMDFIEMEITVFKDEKHYTYKQFLASQLSELEYTYNYIKSAIEEK